MGLDTFMLFGEEPPIYEYTPFCNGPDEVKSSSENTNFSGDENRRHRCRFRSRTPDRRRKDEAVRRCRELCRDRVVEEIKRRKGTSTAKHLKLVLSVIDERAVKDE